MNKQRLLDKTILIIICITIFVSSIFIGSPIAYNANIVTILALLLFIVYVVIQKFIIRDFKLFKNKIDIGIFILFLSTFIPLVFGTYKDIGTEIRYIFMYFTVFVTYIMLRDLILRNKKYVSYILNCIIISSVFIALIGIDTLTTNIFSEMYCAFGNPEVFNQENRMFSIFGYENAFAILMAINFILCIGQYLKSENIKIKNLYFAASYIFLSSVMLSYSRATLVLLVAVIIIYMILIKNKKSRIDCAKILITNLILSIAFSIVFQKAIGLSDKSYIAWIAELFIIVFSYLISWLYTFLNDKLYMIKTKTYIKIVSLLFILISIIIILGLHISKPLKLFADENEYKDIKYKILNIESNSYYKFTFDISSKTIEDNIYEIQIIEENKYLDSICTHGITFGEFEGIKTLDFTTNPETIEIALIFKTTNRNFNEGMIINNLEINNKPYIINYAYLPEKLVTKIQSINFSSKGVWERGTFYKDAINIIKDNWIFGLGADGWLYTYKSIQSYNYSSTQVHSYPLQVFIDYGIIAFLSLIYILVIFIYLIIKFLFNKNQKDELQITLICALSLLLVHCLFDFEMSFMHIMYVFILLFAMITSNIYNTNKDIKKRLELKSGKIFNLVDNLILSLLIIGSLISIYFNTIDFTGKLYIKNNNNMKIEILENYSKLVPYNNQYSKTILKTISNPKDNNNNTSEKSKYYISKLLDIDEQNVQENVQYLIENNKLIYTLEYNEAKYAYEKLANLNYTSDIRLLINQNQNLKDFCNIAIKSEKPEIREYGYKGFKYIIDNYETNKDKINNKDKNRLDGDDIIKYIEKLDNIYLLAIEEVVKYEG